MYYLLYVYFNSSVIYLIRLEVCTGNNNLKPLNHQKSYLHVIRDTFHYLKLLTSLLHLPKTEGDDIYVKGGVTCMSAETLSELIFIRHEGVKLIYSYFILKEQMVNKMGEKAENGDMKLYHERQVKELCALHALNNLLQSEQAFTKKDLDDICNRFV